MPPRACASSASPRTSASTARSSYPSWTRPRTGPGWRGRAGRGVREVRPDVVISYNDFGGYGHPDHIRAAQVAVAAYERAGDPSAHPEQLADGLAPWAPAKLYETVLNFAGRPGILQRVSERGAEREAFMARMAAASGPVTTSVDVAAFLERKRAAIEEHATQIHRDGVFLGLTLDDWRERAPPEGFRLRAARGLAEVRLPEDDLFAGLR